VPTVPPSPETVARARSHFDAGNGYYASGLYQDAIREFQAGYALVPRPSFLVNLGQAYRKLGNLDRAKESYVSYLRSLPAESPLRDQALRVLAELEVQLEERGRTQETPRPPPPAPPAIVKAAPPEPPAPAPLSGARWIGFGVAAAGVGLVVAGTVLEVRAKNLSDDLTRLDRMGATFDSAKDRLGRREQAIGTGLLIGGGAAVVTGVGLYFLLAHRGESARTLALSPAFAPERGTFALSLKGSF
jgi:tetratricopeptide (TPR) repeat protein